MTRDDESPKPPVIGASKERKLRVLLWSAGALLLVLLIGEIVWLSGWLRNSSRVTGVTESEPAEVSRPSDVTNAGSTNYASANSISITFSNPVVEQGIQLLVLDSDPTTPQVIEGVECHQLLLKRPTTYAYFTIDPSFKLTNHFDLEAEVEYFDASRGQMRLQYDAWSSHRAQGRNYSTPRRVVTTGSREWRTNRFWMPDVRFENRLYAEAVFRVEASGPEFYLRRITLRRDVPVHDGPYARSNAVSITLGSSLISQGLDLVNAPDSVKFATRQSGQDCHGVQPGPTGSGYLYLAVDRSFKARHPGPCSVEVEYFSPGSSRFRIEYDGEINGAASEYEATGTVMAVVGVWATNIFDLPTPRFKNAQNDEADFRLNTFNNLLLIRKVTVRPRR
jgi:hypothetical protein